MPPLDLACLRLAAPHRALLLQLLAQHVPAADVWAYGSRVSGGAHDGSDLDLSCAIRKAFQQRSKAGPNSRKPCRTAACRCWLKSTLAAFACHVSSGNRTSLCGGARCCEKATMIPVTIGGLATVCWCRAECWKFHFHWSDSVLKEFNINPSNERRLSNGARHQHHITSPILGEPVRAFMPQPHRYAAAVLGGFHRAEPCGRTRVGAPVGRFRLVPLYARIGRDIVLRQDAQGWDAKVISRAGRARYWNSTSGAVCTRAKGRR